MDQHTYRVCKKQNSESLLGWFQRKFKRKLATTKGPKNICPPPPPITCTYPSGSRCVSALLRGLRFFEARFRLCPEPEVSGKPKGDQWPNMEEMEGTKGTKKARQQGKNVMFVCVCVCVCFLVRNQSGDKKKRRSLAMERGHAGKAACGSGQLAFRVDSI